MRFSRPTLLYGIGYLFCIPLFAIIYSNITDGFYQSTIRIENSYTDHAKTIAQKLCDASAHLLSGATQEERDAARFSVGRYVFASSDMKCDRLRIEPDDRLGFTMRITLHRSPPCAPESCKDTAVVPLLITLSPFDIKSIYPEQLKFNEFETPYLHPLKFEPLSLPLLSPEVAESGSIDDSSNKLKDGKEKMTLNQEIERALFKGFDGVPAVLLEGKFDEELSNFLKESNGFTSSASDNCMRMLYLSAITITTIGYGDIVPITPRARLFVTIEAVVGAIFIGLFLSSLAPGRNP
jgi:hypothetical protein